MLENVWVTLNNLLPMTDEKKQINYFIEVTFSSIAILMYGTFVFKRHFTFTSWNIGQSDKFTGLVSERLCTSNKYYSYTFL